MNVKREIDELREKLRRLEERVFPETQYEEAGLEDTATFLRDARSSLRAASEHCPPDLVAPQ